METMTLKIGIPEGYEIDKEKSTFEILVLKKIENKFSKDWKEFCKNNPTGRNEVFIDNCSTIPPVMECSKRDKDFDKNLIPSKFAEPMLALMQLLTIREKEYTKGWEPDWGHIGTAKFVIKTQEDKITSPMSVAAPSILSFPTKELRDEFFKNWKDLLEIAKPLL